MQVSINVSLNKTYSLNHIALLCICRKCRYEKCLSVGLLPYLVNTNAKKPKIIKQETSTDVMPMLPSNTVVRLSVTTPVTRELDIDTMLMQNNAENIIVAAFEDVFFVQEEGAFSRIILEIGNLI